MGTKTSVEAKRQVQKKLALVDYKEVDKSNGNGAGIVESRDPCNATNDDDVMNERSGTDTNDALCATYDLQHEKCNPKADTATGEGKAGPKSKEEIDGSPSRQDDEMPDVQPAVVTKKAVSAPETKVPEAPKVDTAKESPKPRNRIHNWTLSDEILADIACHYCQQKGSIRKSGQYRVEPIRGPSLRCKNCTRTYQGGPVLSLMNASAHSPTVFAAMRQVEKWIANHKQDIASGNSASVAKTVSTDWIALAVRKHKKHLQCPKCKSKGTLTLCGSNGSRRVIRCSDCRKTQIGDAAETTLANSLGKNWMQDIALATAEEKLDTALPSKQTAQKPSPVPTTPVTANGVKNASRVQRKTPSPIQAVEATKIRPPTTAQLPQKEPRKQTTEGSRDLQTPLHRDSMIDEGNRSQSTDEYPVMEEDTQPPQRSREPQLKMVTVPQEAWETLLTSVRDMSRSMRELQEQNRALSVKFEELTQAQNERTALTRRVAQSPEVGSGSIMQHQKSWPSLPERQPETASAARIAPAYPGGPAPPMKRRWSEGARRENMEKLPDTQRARLHETMRALQAGNLRIDRSPAVDVVYVRDIRRAPLGQIRRSLQHSIPSSALLGLSFIGGSVLEIVTLKSQKDKLVDTLRLLGIEPMRNFDVMDDALKKQQNTSAGIARERDNVERVVRRMQHCIRDSRNDLATKWYAAQLQRANEKITKLNQDISTPAPIVSTTKRTSPAVEDDMMDQSIETGSETPKDVPLCPDNAIEHGDATGVSRRAGAPEVHGVQLRPMAPQSNGIVAKVPGATMTEPQNAKPVPL